MSLNVELHRIASYNELNCSSCLAYSKQKSECCNVNTHFLSTHWNNTCKYHYSSILNSNK